MPPVAGCVTVWVAGWPAASVTRVTGTAQRPPRALGLSGPVCTGQKRDSCRLGWPLRDVSVLDQGRLGITAVLEEAALHQAVGDATVMNAQLGQLAAFGEGLPQVTIQVLPFSSGAHPASGAGPLEALELADATSPGVVHPASRPSALAWTTRQPALPWPGRQRRRQDEHRNARAGCPGTLVAFPSGEVSEAPAVRRAAASR